LNKMPSVMVCVTTQRACERLIQAGAEAAEPSQAPLHVVHVTGSHQRFFNMEDEGAALEYLFAVSKRYGADMAVLRSEDVARTLADFARENGAGLIIFGQSNEVDRPGNIIDRVRDLLSDTGVSIAIQSRTSQD
jgi:K+-sensing histidine kinase KdpD